MGDIVIGLGSMLLRKALRAFEEIIILDLLTVLAVKVVPCYVHCVPDTVLHFDVIPHMSRILFLNKISENTDTWDIQPVAHELERLGVALADHSRFYNSAKSGAAELCFKVVICKIGYIVMYAL